MRKNYKICVMTSDHRLKVKQYPSCKKFTAIHFQEKSLIHQNPKLIKASAKRTDIPYANGLKITEIKKVCKKPKISAVNKKKKTNGRCKGQGIIEQIDG